MTNANNFSEIAPAKESAIEVQSTNVVPLAITADTQSAIAAFTARPSVAAIGSALSAVRDGFTFAYEHEKEFSTGQNFFGFLWNAGKAILGPLLYLLWFGLNTLHVWRKKPETCAAAAAKWQSLKAWAAPKFDYETEADRQSELEL